MKDLKKEFFASTWAINNRTAIYILTVIISLAGLMAYNGLPKENFPEIVIPKVFVQTGFPGVSPSNMENLVTKPLEKRFKSISGVKKITSNSYQDYSIITVEFNTDVEIKDAKQKVKDEIDKAKGQGELPDDLPSDPKAMDIDLSQLPIMYLNISGDFDLNKLKDYADQLKDRVEAMKEITKVEMVGALDREIQINVDLYKANAAQVGIWDIMNAVGSENLTISGGTVRMDEVRRTINIKKEFRSVEEIGNLIVKSPSGAPLYLKDLAEIKDGFEEQESYARLGGKNVITLNVIKRSGENLIEASDKIRDLVAEMKKSNFPKDLNVVITGDQSDQTRITLHDLINTIVIGFILVTIILMFFMGATNAIFVALSVPLSMFLAFLFLPTIGFSMNMIVLFAFLLALGIVVDDAIVVIENTHRIYNNGKTNITDAAKYAAGEVFVPVLAGTLTTLAPFIPLAFWDGVIGEFMFFLPITLIITLLASLLVAYVMNPVFAVSFMKPHNEDANHKPTFSKGVKVTSIVFVALTVLFYLGGNFGMGNFLVLMLGLYLLHHFYLVKVIHRFQNNVWPKVVNRYERLLKWSLHRPKTLLVSTVGLLIFSFIFFGIRGPAIVFFPQSDPNFTFVYVSLPVGTDQQYTNKVISELETKVFELVKNDSDVVSSVISNVTVGVTDPQDEDQGVYPNRGRISVSYVPFAKRNGKSTREIFQRIENAMKDYPGAEISVAAEQAGPPTAKPISIEITGEDLDEMLKTSKGIKRYLDSLKIEGVQELKSDFQDNKPEIVFDIDRERANREGISVRQIGGQIQMALMGSYRPSKFRDLDDEYPIQVRYKEEQRNNIAALKNMNIIYRDMAMGGRIRQVPVSAFADIRYENTYAGIKRKNQKRIITIGSNISTGYNPNEVVAKVQAAMDSYTGIPETVKVVMTGEQEEQKETGAFLGRALLISLGLILIILVTQFNSLGKPIIILSEIIFSIIGVLLGVATFKMDMSIVMTGIGIVALAGIVVRNGILLVEFADLMVEQGMGTYDALIEAGRTRMTPVLLTASATILGLIPLAVGLNIDFVKLFTEFNPHIFFGGDSVAFWGPLSWTMIFGLGFATFLTLILVPVMYLLHANMKTRLKALFAKK